MLLSVDNHQLTNVTFTLTSYITGLLDHQVTHIAKTLQTEADHLAGELQLGHLYELTLDLLSDANHPNGDCAFCLQPLLQLNTANNTLTNDASSHSLSNTTTTISTTMYDAQKVLGSAVIKIECYHCFHKSCFASWFNWMQQRLTERAAEIQEEYKSMAHLQIEKEGIEVYGDTTSSNSSSVVSVRHGTESTSKDDDDDDTREGQTLAAKRSVEMFIVRCPACREKVSFDSINHLSEDLVTHPASYWTEQKTAPVQLCGSSSSNSATLELDTATLHAMKKLQQRFATVEQKQRQCGGLVEDSVGVTVDEMQRAMENARLVESLRRQQQQNGGSSSLHQHHNNDRNRQKQRNDSGRGTGTTSAAVSQHISRGRGRNAGRGRGRGKRCWKGERK